LSKLCASGGKGLEELLKLVALHSLDPVALSEHPIPNEAIFKKFGIVDQNSIPLPKADRAFQDLCMLKRNWVLLMFTQTILSKLVRSIVSSRSTRHTERAFRNRAGSSSVLHQGIFRLSDRKSAARIFPPLQIDFLKVLQRRRSGQASAISPTNCVQLANLQVSQISVLPAKKAQADKFSILFQPKTVTSSVSCSVSDARKSIEFNLTALGKKILLSTT
jgi:hypothetical protein